MANTPKNEPTPDQIALTILQMLNTLHLLDCFPDIPFFDNVQRAIKEFDTPEIRSSLVDRLYHPEKYAAQSAPKP